MATVQVDCADADCLVDGDGDTFDAAPCGLDCDDGNALVNPGVAEICDDGIDNDCDGDVDCADADCQVDGDGDGFDAAPCGLDCDDGNDLVNPDAAENCTDAIDNNCDGATDCDDADCDGISPCDCVPTHSKEKGPRCSDGIDNDCDGLIDGADPDCQ